MSDSNPPLELRPARPEDEAQVRTAHAELAEEGFTFAMLLQPETRFDVWVARTAAMAEGQCLPEGWVPSTGLLGVVGDTVVGRLSVRHELSDWLLHEGGHIGYGVRPQYRGRGYAGAMLDHGVGLLRRQGVDRVLVTCDADNAASAAVIERGGGELADVRTRGDGVTPVRRYWIIPGD